MKKLSGYSRNNLSKLAWLSKIRVFVLPPWKIPHKKTGFTLYILSKTAWLHKIRVFVRPFENYVKKIDFPHHILSIMAKLHKIRVFVWTWFIPQKEALRIIFCRKWHNCTKLEYLSGPDLSRKKRLYALYFVENDIIAQN